MKENRHEKAELFGIEFFKETLSGIFEKIRTNNAENKRLRIGYLNIHTLNLAYKKEKFRNILKSFEIKYIDGFGVKLLLEALNQKGFERFTGADFVEELLNFAEREKLRLGILAGKPHVNQKLKNKLKSRHPSLRLEFLHHGYEITKKRFIKELSAISLDLLLVGTGSPLQEEWIVENFDSLPKIRIFWAVGAMFDFYTGEKKRGKNLLTQNGFEWLARFIAEPVRLFPRYIIGNPLFYMRFMAWKIKKIFNKAT